MPESAQTASADDGRIGFIGLGRMGFALASSLVRNGRALSVYDVNEARADEMTGTLVRRERSAGDVAAACGVIFLMLPGPKEVLSVALEPGGVFDRARPGTVVVDMSTVDPATCDTLSAEAARRGLAYADSPVGRLAAHADRGQSLFMVGADDGVFRRIRPLLDDMGTTIFHCGRPGNGTRTKLVNNFLVLSYCQLNSEALTLATAMGLDVRKTLDVVLETTASNGQLREKWPVKVLRGDTTPGFDIALGLKDLTLACRAAEEAGVAVSLGEAARDIFRRALDEGYAGQDTSALTDYWAKANKRPPIRLPEALPAN